MPSLNILAEGGMDTHKQWLDQSLPNCSIPEASWYFSVNIWHEHMITTEIPITIVTDITSSTYLFSFRVPAAAVLLEIQVQSDRSSLFSVFWSLLLSLLGLKEERASAGFLLRRVHEAPCTDALKSYPERCLEGAIHPPWQLKHLLCLRSQDITFALFLPSYMYLNRKLGRKHQL